MNILEILDRPIAFHRPFVTLTGSVTAALMLSQSVYWQARTTDPAGWFYKSASEWTDETGLSRREQETARRILRETKIVEEDLRGVPATLHFRVNSKELADALRAIPAAGCKTSLAESAKLDSRNSPNKKSGKRQTTNNRDYTENTAYASLVGIEGFAEEWNRFKDHRRALKKPMTDHAEDLTLEKLALWPEKAIAVLRECVERGWQSFKWDWPEIVKLTGGPIRLPENPGDGKTDDRKRDLRRKYGVNG